MYGAEVSPTLISNVTHSVLEEVQDWQARALDAVYPILYFDCLFVKSRQDGSIRNKAVYLALGINLEGEKELLGMWLGETEGAKFWLNIFNRTEEPRGAGLLHRLRGWDSGDCRKPLRRFTRTPRFSCVSCIRSATACGLSSGKTANGWLRISGRSTQRRRWRPPELRWGRLPNTGGSGIRRLCRAGRRNWERLTPFFSFPPEIPQGGLHYQRH